MTRKTMEELTWTKERVMNEGVYGEFSCDGINWRKGWCFFKENSEMPFRVFVENIESIYWFSYYRPIPEAKPLSQEYLTGKRICDMRIKDTTGGEYSVLCLTNDKIFFGNNFSCYYEELKTSECKISFDNGLTYQACEVME